MDYSSEDTSLDLNAVYGLWPSTANTESEISHKEYPVLPLSDRDETILMVQRLQTRIVPNHEVSRVVSRTIAQHKKQVNGLIETIENEFKSINHDIERQIVDACLELRNTLNVQENSLSCILEDRNSDDFMESDFLQKCFKNMNHMIDERNANVKDFMDTLHELEKMRTSMIESCYKKHMLVIKRLSSDAFEELYKKYLKNYNSIKFSNFRTYEDIRFKLIQLNENLQRDFVLKTYDVKMKIKENTMKRFLDKLRYNTNNMTWDKIENSQTQSIEFTNSLTNLLYRIMVKPKHRFSFEYVIACSDRLKSHLKDLEKIINITSRLHNEIINDVQMILTNTMGELNQILIDLGLSPSSAESAAIFGEMTTITKKAQNENVKTILDIQVFLRDVKESIKTIGTMLGPAMEIFYRHSERLAKVKRVIAVALDKKFKSNDLKFNNLENNFNATTDTLIEASNENEVIKCEKKCEELLQNIKDRIQTNQYSETEVFLNFKDLMESELEVTKLEAEIVLGLYPDYMKPLPDFDDVESESRIQLVEKTIPFLKSSMEVCQKKLYKRVSWLISELKSSTLLDKRDLALLLNHIIDGRFNIAKRALEFRTLKLRNGTFNKRLNEIKEHQKLLEHHIEVVQEIRVTLTNETNKLYEKFYEEKKEYESKNIIHSEIDDMPSEELRNLIDRHRNQVHLVATEFNDKLKLHSENIEAGFREIIKLTVEYMKSIKMFPEGGNYTHKEAVSIVDTLKNVCGKMLEEKFEALTLLRPTGYGSLTEIKESLSNQIKSLESELEKKEFKQKYVTINKLMGVGIDGEYVNLYKMKGALLAKLNEVEETFKKDDTKESAKRWSEMLTETKSFIDYLVESYRDIKMLLKSEVTGSVWNTRFEKPSTSSETSENTERAFHKWNRKFRDYCRTFLPDAETTGDSRFLSNIQQTIFHYLSESQNNAADLASIGRTNSWIGTDQPDEALVYHEIMRGAVKKSKAAASRAEVIWVFELSDFLDFLAVLHVAESKFKNIVLATYHRESVAKLDEAFGAFEREIKSLRKQLKNVRERLQYKLKPAHGHPQNVGLLAALLDEFRAVRQGCSESLAGACNRIGSDLEKIAGNYEAQCPVGVLKATSSSVECQSSLRARLNHINPKKFTPQIDISSTEFENGESRVVPETVELRISSSENGVKEALRNAKKHLESTLNAVFWPNNSQLWADNVRIFMKLYRDHMSEVQIFSAVEKSKILDWASAFVRDVEQVKRLHQ